MMFVLLTVKGVTGLLVGGAWMSDMFGIICCCMFGIICGDVCI
jgi:hypothetical protein